MRLYFKKCKLLYYIIYLHSQNEYYPSIKLKNMKRYLQRFALLFLSVMLVYGFRGVVWADVGPPPIYSQGGAIHSSALATNVSMEYEKVILTYGDPQRQYSSFDGKEYLASMPVHVSAVFKMKNNGKNVERMNVFFPSNDSAFIGGTTGVDDIALSNFRVNQKMLSKESQTEIPLSINGKEEKILTYQWEEVFYPQQITEITVEYDTKSGKDYQVYYLTYVLGTGSGWQGTIKQGEINFILPENLTSYAVLNQAPMVKGNTFPFTTLGNTIIVRFSDYEPNSDDAIVLGVYEFDKIHQIESLKKELQTFSNVLKIAELFKELSEGPHCDFCTGTASDFADQYYKLALDLARSKDELNAVLKSLVYGDGDRGNITDLIRYMSLDDCRVTDMDCKMSIYFERDKLGDTPFRLHRDNGEVGERDFLLKYGEKMQIYDTHVTASIHTYINEAQNVFEYRKRQQEKKQIESSPSPMLPTTPLTTFGKENVYVQQKQTNYVLIKIGLVCAVIGITMLFLWLSIRKKVMRILKMTYKKDKKSDQIGRKLNHYLIGFSDKQRGRGKKRS